MIKKITFLLGFLVNTINPSLKQPSEPLKQNHESKSLKKGAIDTSKLRILGKTYLFVSTDFWEEIAAKDKEQYSKTEKEAMERIEIPSETWLYKFPDEDSLVHFYNRFTFAHHNEDKSKIVTLNNMGIAVVWKSLGAHCYERVSRIGAPSNNNFVETIQVINNGAQFRTKKVDCNSGTETFEVWDFNTGKKIHHYRIIH